MQRVEDVEGRFFENLLQGGGDGFVPRLQRLFRLAGRAQQFFQLARVDLPDDRLAAVPGHAYAFGPVTEIRQLQLESSIGLQVNEAPQLAGKCRFAIWRQAHDLVFVAILQEAQILCEGKVQQS